MHYLRKFCEGMGYVKLSLPLSWNMPWSLAYVLPWTGSWLDPR